MMSLSGSEQFKTKDLKQRSLWKLIPSRHFWELPASGITQRLKVLTFIYRHLQGNPGQRRFTIRSGVLTGNDTRRRSKVAATHHPKNGLWTHHSLQLDRHIYDPENCEMKAMVRLAGDRTMVFISQFSPATTHKCYIWLFDWNGYKCLP